MVLYNASGELGSVAECPSNNRVPWSGSPHAARPFSPYSPAGTRCQASPMRSRRKVQRSIMS